MTPENSFSKKVQESREAGFSDDEIAHFLSQKDSSFGEKYLQSKSEGFNSSEIFSYLGVPPLEKKQIQEPGVVHQGARLGMMAGKGLALAQAPVLIPEIIGQGLHYAEQTPTMQTANIRRAALDEIESMEDQKSLGEWSKEDDERLESFRKIAGMSSEQMEKEGLFYEAANLSPTAIFKETGKLAGIDTEAKNTLEKGVEFTSMLASGRPQSALIQAPKFLTSKMNKVFSPEIANFAKSAMKTAPVIVPSAIAEESLGVPMEVSLLGLGLGKATMDLGKMALSKGGKKFFLFDPTNLKVRNFKESVQKELGREQEYLQQQVIEGIIKAKDLKSMQPFMDKAVEMGIPITPNTLVNSKYFRNMEKLVSQNEMTVEKATEFRQQVAKDWADLTNKSLKRMETNLEFSTPGSTAEALMSDVTQAQHKKLVSEYTEGYKKSSQELKGSENLEIRAYRELEDSVNHVLDDIGESLFPTTAEVSAKELGKKVKKSFTLSAKEAGHPELAEVTLPTGKKSIKEIAKGEAEKIGAQAKIEVNRPTKKSLEEELKKSREKIQKSETKQKETFLKSEEDLKNLFGEDAKYMRLDENGHIRFVKAANGATLVRTIQSLNKIVDWENPGIVNLYAHTRQTAKDILQRQYGKSNPEAIKHLEKANEQFAQTQKLFGKQSKWKKWGINSESNSEELLRTINSAEKMKQFEKDFGNTAQGKLYIDHLKHKKAQEILDPIFSKRDYKPGDVASALDKLKRDPYFRHIVPEETWKNLSEIASLDAKIEQKSANFFKDHVPKDKSDRIFFNTRQFISHYAGGWVKDLSQNRRANAYADFFLDPSYTKKSKDLLEKILVEMQKPNPNLQQIAKYDGLIGNIGNDLSQLAKVSSVEAITK